MASQWPPKKNTAFTLHFTLYKNDGTVVGNPGTYTKKVSIDGGAVADIAAAVTENDTTYGHCQVVLAAGEMNGDRIWVYITDNTSGTVPFTCTLYTSAYTQDEIGVDVAAVHTHAGTIETDVAAVHTHINDLHDTDIADIHTDIGTMQTMLTDIHGTDLPAVKTQTQDIHDTLDLVHTDVDAIHTHIDDIHDTDLPAVKTMTDKIGTVTNTGGTATIGAILGDFANTALVTRVADLHTDVADNHTDIGTALGYIDTEIGAIVADVAAVHTHVSDCATATALSDLHTDVGTAIADIAAVHVHAQTIIDDVAAVHTHINDIHDTDLSDLHTDVAAVKTVVDDIHTDVGTAITNIGDVHATDLPDIHTDLGTLQAMVTDIHGTDLPAVKADTAAILEDTGTTLPATLAALPAAIWNYLTTAMTTVGSIGKALADWLTALPAGSSLFGATDLAICNNALMLLGNNAIDDITDNTKAAKLCNQFYQKTVDAVLRAYTWNCATLRSSALVAVTTPEFGYGYAYDLPASCLRVLMIEDDPTIEFKVENSHLLTDEATAKISYIARISMSDADSLLIDAISARLAATIAFALTNSTSATEAMWKLYKDKLDEAQTIDAFEGTAPQMASDDWINSRS